MGFYVSAEGTILFAYFQSERGHGNNTAPILVNIVLHNATLVSFHFYVHIMHAQLFIILAEFNPKQHCYILYILVYIMISALIKLKRSKQSH